MGVAPSRPFTAKVVEVPAADTVVLALPGAGAVSLRCRLARVVVPNANSADCGERLVARRALEYLQYLVLRRTVELRNVRTLRASGEPPIAGVVADVFTEDGVHVNRALLDRRFAAPQRLPAEDWLDYHVVG